MASPNHNHLSPPRMETSHSQSSNNTWSGFTSSSHATACNPSQDIDIITAWNLNEPAPRTLVLCFDGTGDQFDADNSNIIKLFTMLQKDDPAQQLVYYQAGIGTYTPPQIATPRTATISKALDEAIAIYLNAHVMSGYEFLMQNYQAGDKICLFGFSRGAYTARALAGMIHKVGLLPKDNHQQVPFAYHMFCRADETGWKQSTAFKKAFSMDVDIHFIGVWDTVCSVGLLAKELPFVSSNGAIKTFRQALSLDEHRAKFKANHYNRPTDAEAKLGTKPGEMPKPGVRRRFNLFDKHRLSVPVPIDEDEDERKEAQEETQFSSADGHNNMTDVLEVWFAGCHCDVGGGSVPNDSIHNLARIPLRWMIREIFDTNVGLRFHSDLLKQVGLEPKSLFPQVLERPPAITELSPDVAKAVLDQEEWRMNAKKLQKKGRTAADIEKEIGREPVVVLTEEEEDFVDAHCDIYDQLKLALWWWILEIIPFQHRTQNTEGKWSRQWYINWGRGRAVPDPVDERAEFNVHRTVQTRLNAKTLKGGPYKWNARFLNGKKQQPNYVP
ncbi:hypothetical protein CERSUDRAFT_110803 [Gelatoporia subvermispora B]|uniref:T6SS Phospholipase effector Tle1-like catalytic domain-containing protein n=1 Tax=Ceriporiopsis subvermispora (strain B) TaxID=914234 RepID=M2RCV3_CERS8|nr:hypothetical protein CERSUDRAFT_110803 [Gelatoporia subvermispora B]